MAYHLYENNGVVKRNEVLNYLNKLNQDERKKLRNLGVKFGRYHVFLFKLFKIVIKSKFNYKGTLSLGELIIPGKSKQEVMISTYICHPAMANNELSGPALSVELAKWITKRNH